MTNFPSMKKVHLKIVRAKRNLLGVNHLSKSNHLECYFSVVLKNHALTYITKTNIYFFSKFLKLFLVHRYKDPRYKDIKTLFPIKKQHKIIIIYIYIYIYSCTRISGYQVILNCNWTRTHNHFVHKRTLNYLAELAK